MYYFTPEELEMTKRGLEMMKVIFETRVNEARSGALSPDEKNLTEALRELEIVNNALEQLNNG